MSTFLQTHSLRKTFSDIDIKLSKPESEGARPLSLARASINTNTSVLFCAADVSVLGGVVCAFGCTLRPSTYGDIQGVSISVVDANESELVRRLLAVGVPASPVRDDLLLF